MLNFDDNFIKPSFGQKDIEPDVIHVLTVNKQNPKSFRSFLRDLNSTKVLRILLSTRLQVKKYLKYVRWEDDGDLIKHLGKDFIVPQFEDSEEIIRISRGDEHHPFWVPIHMIERKQYSPEITDRSNPTFYISKSDVCFRYARVLEEWRINTAPRTFLGFDIYWSFCFKYYFSWSCSYS